MYLFLAIINALSDFCSSLKISEHKLGPKTMFNVRVAPSSDEIHLCIANITIQKVTHSSYARSTYNWIPLLILLHE